MTDFLLDCRPELTPSGLLEANSFVNVSNVSLEGAVLSCIGAWTIIKLCELIWKSFTTHKSLFMKDT